MKVAFNFNPEGDANSNPEQVAQPNNTPSQEDIPTKEEEVTSETALGVQEEVALPTTTIENKTKEDTANNNQDDLTEDAVLSFLNKKNETDFKTLDDYRKSLEKEKVVEKVIEKEAELDPETQAYYRFNKETGGSFKDWMLLNENLDDKSDYQIAIQKIKADNKGFNLTEQQAKILLSEELNVDVEDLSDLTEKEQLKLKILASKYKTSLAQEREKYNQPIEQKKQSQSDDDFVIVQGRKIPKADYNNQRQEYLRNREAAVKGLTSDKYEIEVETREGKKKMSLEYLYSEQDKQDMLSSTETVDAILSDFVDKDGKFQHSEWNEGAWWAKRSNREKALKTLMSSARSEGIEEVMKEERNINFDSKSKPNQNPKSSSPIEDFLKREQSNGMSVKYKF